MQRNDTMFDALNKLKQDLNESNQLNTSNLTILNDHIQLAFGYFRDAFVALMRQKRILQDRLFSLQNKLRECHLQYFLEEQYDPNNPNFRQSLHNINQKIRKTITKTTKASQITSEPRPQGKCNTPSKKLTIKQQTRLEFSKATSFVRGYLINKLEEEPTRTEQLPKNAFLNMYLKWREKKQQPVDYQFSSSIQMALTNEIKRHFPASSHNSRCFKGIRFRQQYKPFLKNVFKSDIKAIDDDDEESPPLPTFPDDHLAV